MNLVLTQKNEYLNGVRDPDRRVRIELKLSTLLVIKVFHGYHTFEWFIKATADYSFSNRPKFLV